MASTDRPDDEERESPAGRDVISSLPHHRPHRRSAKRGAAGAAGSAGRASAAGAKAAEKLEAEPAKPAAAKPKRATRPKAKASGAAAVSSKPKRATAKPAAASTRSPRERIGATAGAKTRDPAAERPEARPTDDKPAGPPSGTELIGTAVQAAGELASIGLKLGTQAVKNAVGRLPKP